MRRRFATLTIATTLGAVAMLGLAGCTGSPTATSSSGSSGSSSSSGSSQNQDATGDDGQSTQDACALVQETITEATDQFENASAEDPSAVVDAMKAAAEKLSATSSQITNDEVSALLPALQEMFAQTGDVMEAIIAGDTDKMNDLSDLGAKFQETSESFQELCGA